MSGIMAIVSLDGRSLPADLPRAQLAAIAHRGEWEPRLWEAPGVALGHVNLPRTPEAEREVLPMSDTSGRYWLTWDGRLDNRDELGPLLGYDVAERAEKPDAAYVLDAFIKWGDDCVHHLLGDWAVVIWDNHSRRLFCAKDPIGWRQLYWAEHDGLLAVGSEPQQFFANGWLPKTADWEQVRQFIDDEVRNPNGTGYCGLWALRGGERTSSDVTAPEIYWAKPRASLNRKRSVRDTVEEFAELFNVALICRLRTNRPLGVFLSGGLDSSYIAGLAAERARLLAISAFVPGTRFDERKYIAALVTHVPLEDVRYFDASDCWALSSRWLQPHHFDRMDMPAQAAYYVRLGRAAQQAGVGVVLGGEGADEVMMAYPNVGETLLEGSLREAFRQSGRRGRSLRRRVGCAIRDLQESVPSTQRFLPSRFRAPQVPSLRSVLVQNEEITRVMGSQPSRDSWLRSAQRWDTYRFTADTTVSWRDRHSATPFGFEHRAPFFDLRVVEFMASVPEWQKCREGRFKSVLRDAENGIVPDLIANRPDKGTFNSTIVDGLRRHERDRFTRCVATVAAGPLQLACDANELLDRWGSLNLERELVWRAVTSGMWLQHGFNGPEAHSDRELVGMGRG